jgi:soluble lytic murein transglycosylase-like protein
MAANFSKIHPRHQLGASAAPAHISLALLATATVLFFHLPPLVKQDAPLAPPSLTAVADPVPANLVYPESLDRTQYALARHLSRRYRIASEAAESVVRITYGVGKECGVDPLLILAMIAVESRFNPIAESEMGAKGLMQVIPKYHWELFGESGVDKSLYPAANIRAGTRVLKGYLRHAGNLQAALQMYNGSDWDEGNHYAQRILAERARYLQVVQTAPTLLASLAVEPGRDISRR